MYPEDTAICGVDRMSHDISMVQETESNSTFSAIHYHFLLYHEQGGSLGHNRGSMLC